MDVSAEPGPGEIEKTLYMLVYHTSRKHTRDTPYYLNFFYAENAEEAREKANKRKREIIGPVYEVELKPCPEGFTARHTHMDGKMQFHPDGKAL